MAHGLGDAAYLALPDLEDDLATRAGVTESTKAAAVVSGRDVQDEGVTDSLDVTDCRRTLSLSSISSASSSAESSVPSANLHVLGRQGQQRLAVAFVGGLDPCADGRLIGIG